MDAALLLTRPEPTSVVWPTFKLNAPLPDESLALSAISQWRQSTDGLREVLKATPGMRDTLNRQLREKLDVDGENTGLLFPATDQQPERLSVSPRPAPSPCNIRSWTRI